MFKAVAGERHVVFSWSPHVTDLHGAIDNYTLSCSPSPSSLPQSPSSQSGSLTATGFSPNTLYSCSLTPNNLWGSGPPARATFTTKLGCKLTKLIQQLFTTEKPLRYLFSTAAKRSVTLHKSISKFIYQLLSFRGLCTIGNTYRAETGGC